MKPVGSFLTVAPLCRTLGMFCSTEVIFFLFNTSLRKNNELLFEAAVVSAPLPVFPCDRSARVTNSGEHLHRLTAGLKCHFTPS